MAATTLTSGTAPSTRPRLLRRVLWVFQIFFGLFLIGASALPKFAGQKDAVETFTLIGWGQWFRYVTGAVELAGGIGLLIPRLAGAAAAGLVGLMTGAALTHFLVTEPVWALLPIGMGVVFALIAWDRREQTRDLIRSLKR
ncbi:DoxX family protein [Sphaerisporangium dianthi]|uniref:DoxX family protein n=1 Tax=Sphaerisporangium dianthi TaxID=1436120 RepID=A0ABV9CCC6_9ACTN